MNPISITLIKQTFTAQDGNLISGVQINLCPMIFKFIALSRQKLDLLSEIRPDLYQWFVNSPDGATLILTEPTVHTSNIPNYKLDNQPNSL